jgi:hypothetical protein
MRTALYVICLYLSSLCLEVDPGMRILTIVLNGIVGAFLLLDWKNKRVAR